MTKPLDETTDAQTDGQQERNASLGATGQTGGTGRKEEAVQPLSAASIKQTIADQNDRFRALDPAIPGQVLVTSGVQQLFEDENCGGLGALMEAIKTFDAFSTDNDPHGEHDFGSLTFEGERLFWKIDLYDLNFQYGSEEPSNLAKTRRVLTIMLPQEY